MKLMKAYFFLTKHPKFEVEFPVDGSKPLPKHPYPIRKNNILDTQVDLSFDPENGSTFVGTPGKKERPVGREQLKHVDAINLIMYKVSQKATVMHGKAPTIHDMWSKIESAISIMSKHIMRAIAQN